MMISDNHTLGFFNMWIWVFIINHQNLAGFSLGLFKTGCGFADDRMIMFDD